MTRSKLPLLGPGTELLRVLLEHSLEELVELAESRGIEIPADSDGVDVANRIIREKYRAGTDELYAVQDNCFLNVDEYLPFLTEFTAKYRPTRISELGAGTGLFASLLAPVMPADGVYLGSDFSDAGVVRARARLAGDARFTFVTADAEVGPMLENTDCVLFPWVMNWLDTHAVERIWVRLAAIRPAPIVISCVHFRDCVERRPGVTTDDATDIAAAEAYLRGDRAAAEAIWDVERYDCYVRSLAEHFEILEENVQPGAHIFWAKRSRGITAA